MNYDQNQFVRQWWKQAQKQGTILTKPQRKKYELAQKNEVIRSLKQDILNIQNSVDAQVLNQAQQEIARLNQDLNSILTRWNWDGINPKNAEEFLNKFATWINEQIENKKTWTKQIQAQQEELKESQQIFTNTEKDYLAKIQNRNAEINQLAQQLDQTKEKLTFYADNLKTKEGIINDYQADLKTLQGEAEKKDQALTKAQAKTEKTSQVAQENINLAKQKIADLETNLLNLAKQKLTNQKQARTLVEQLEKEWQQDKESHQQQLTQQQEYFAQTLAQTKAEHSQEINSLNHNLNQKQTKITELENQLSVLELKLETSCRESEQKEQEWNEQKQELAQNHQTNLTEQKTFYLEKVSGLEETHQNTFQTQQATIANLEAQLLATQQTLTETRRGSRATTVVLQNAQIQLAQTREYLSTSQQDNQTKQTQINTLNQEKNTLQTRITELTQQQTENTRAIQELNQTNTDLENELINERTDRRQAETSLQEAQTKLAGQKGVLEQLLTNREADSTPSPQASFCLWCHHQRRLVTNKQICHVCDGKPLVTAWAEQKDLVEQELQLIKEVLND